MPSCDVITHSRRRDVELVGGRRRRAANPRTCCCCLQWFVSSPPESAADSAALYEYTYAQRTLGGGETADKHQQPSPRCLIRDHASLPPLLPPPPPPSRDRHSGYADPPSSALAWTRLGSIDHEVYVERCPHVAVHCPSSSARHLLVPATTAVGDVAPSGSAAHYYTRSQLTTTDNEQTVPTSSSTATELQLCRPVDSHQNCSSVS